MVPGAAAAPGTGCVAGAGGPTAGGDTLLTVAGKGTVAEKARAQPDLCFHIAWFRVAPGVQGFFSLRRRQTLVNFAAVA